MKELSLEVNEQTRFKGGITSLSDIKERDLVQVEYKEEGARKIATAIHKSESKSNQLGRTNSGATGTTGGSSTGTGGTTDRGTGPSGM